MMCTHLCVQLDELLRQGASLVPPTDGVALSVAEKSPKGKLARTAHVFNGRVLKNLSLFLVHFTPTHFDI